MKELSIVLSTCGNRNLAKTTDGRSSFMARNSSTTYRIYLQAFSCEAPKIEMPSKCHYRSNQAKRACTRFRCSHTLAVCRCQLLSTHNEKEDLVLIEVGKQTYACTGRWGSHDHGGEKSGDDDDETHVC